MPNYIIKSPWLTYNGEKVSDIIDYSTNPYHYIGAVKYNGSFVFYDAFNSSLKYDPSNDMVFPYHNSSIGIYKSNIIEFNVANSPFSLPQTKFQGLSINYGIYKNDDFRGFYLYTTDNKALTFTIEISNRKAYFKFGRNSDWEINFFSHLEGGGLDFDYFDDGSLIQMHMALGCKDNKRCLVISGLFDGNGFYGEVYNTTAISYFENISSISLINTQSTSESGVNKVGVVYIPQ